MDALIAVSGVVSALAALGALIFAWRTVQETRALRRDDRLARIPELLGDVATPGMLIAHGYRAGEQMYGLPIARHRLRAGLAAAGRRLPACEKLVDIDWYAITTSDGTVTQTNREQADADIAAALDEVAGLLRSRR